MRAIIKLAKNTSIKVKIEEYKNFHGIYFIGCMVGNTNLQKNIYFSINYAHSAGNKIGLASKPAF